MKAEKLIYKILDFVEDGTAGAIDFVDAFLSAGYGASLGKLDYEINKRSMSRGEYKFDREKRRRLQKYLSRLQTDGLISKNSSDRFMLSPRGKKKLSDFKNKKVIFRSAYSKEKSDKIIIVSYDLPIRFNRERDALREVLKLLEFNMIHKSVWVGKVKLPKEFILDLKRLGIIDYVEILEVTKTGTLKSFN
jgi:DNA-binding transcriptional regulator PaaX